MTHGRLFLVSSLLLLAAGAALADAGPGLHETPLYALGDVEVGTLQMWNTNHDLHLELRSTFGGIETIQAWVGTDFADLPMEGGQPAPDLFPYQATFSGASGSGGMVLTFNGQAEPGDLYLMDFSWGDTVRSRMVAVRVVLADGLVFADGFETGDVTAWTNSRKSLPSKTSAAWKPGLGVPCRSVSPPRPGASPTSWPIPSAANSLTHRSTA